MVHDRRLTPVRYEVRVAEDLRDVVPGVVSHDAVQHLQALFAGLPIGDVPADDRPALEVPGTVGDLGGFELEAPAAGRRLEVDRVIGRQIGRRDPEDGFSGAADRLGLGDPEPFGGGVVEAEDPVGIGDYDDGVLDRVQHAFGCRVTRGRGGVEHVVPPVGQEAGGEARRVAAGDHQQSAALADGADEFGGDHVGDPGPSAHERQRDSEARFEVLVVEHAPDHEAQRHEHQAARVVHADVPNRPRKLQPRLGQPHESRLGGRERRPHYEQDRASETGDHRRQGDPGEPRRGILQPVVVEAESREYHRYPEEGVESDQLVYDCAMWKKR
jgi:hypothetical protein